MEFLCATFSGSSNIWLWGAGFPSKSVMWNHWQMDARDVVTIATETTNFIYVGSYMPVQGYVCIVKLQWLSLLQSVEAVLFLLQGVASNVTQQSSPLVQSILSLFPRMPPHPTLIRTSLSLLGMCSSLPHTPYSTPLHTPPHTPPQYPLPTLQHTHPKLTITFLCV